MAMIYTVVYSYEGETPGYSQTYSWDIPWLAWMSACLASSSGAEVHVCDSVGRKYLFAERGRPPSKVGGLWRFFLAWEE